MFSAHVLSCQIFYFSEARNELRSVFVIQIFTCQIGNADSLPFVIQFNSVKSVYVCLREREREHSYHLGSTNQIGVCAG